VKDGMAALTGFELEPSTGLAERDGYAEESHRIGSITLEFFSISARYTRPLPCWYWNQVVVIDCGLNASSIRPNPHFVPAANLADLGDQPVLHRDISKEPPLVARDTWSVGTS
jgi:hypothetical protein